MPTYVITGCSTGIGLELCKQLAARGDKVFATCRKKESSATGVDLISAVTGDVTIVEGIDVMVDDCKAKLAAALAGVAVDVLVCNAGGINGTSALKGGDVFPDQGLDVCSGERMAAAFQLNAVGPLRSYQALAPNLSAGSKVVVVSTGMGSIADNTSGGLYAYRSSKAAANMVAKGMSVDLKKKDIAVLAIAPGFVVTEFGPGMDMLKKMGGVPVELSCAGLVKAMDGLTLETTGRYMTVPKDGSDPTDFGPGW